MGWMNGGWAGVLPVSQWAFGPNLGINRTLGWWAQRLRPVAALRSWRLSR